MGQTESAEAVAQTQIRTNESSNPTSLESVLEGCFSVFHFSCVSCVGINVWLKWNLSLCCFVLLIAEAAEYGSQNTEVCIELNYCFALLLSTLLEWINETNWKNCEIFSLLRKWLRKPLNALALLTCELVPVALSSQRHSCVFSRVPLKKRYIYLISYSALLFVTLLSLAIT